MRVRMGSREVVTLQAETTTPRRRKVTNSYERQCTPAAELYPAGRKRRKAESSARSRALRWFDATRHDAYLVKERERKRAGGSKRERPQATSAPPIPPPPPPPSEADIRQTEADSITNRIAELEADGYKRIQVGPRGWDDVGGWVWQDREGRIRDRSSLWHNKGGAPFHPDLLWRNGHTCGICACTECGITQQPCACEKPWSDRANWGAYTWGYRVCVEYKTPRRTCVPAERGTGRPLRGRDIQ